MEHKDKLTLYMRLYGNPWFWRCENRLFFFCYFPAELPAFLKDIWGRPIGVATGQVSCTEIMQK